MSTTAVRSDAATATPRAGSVDLKLEVVTIPVADTARARDFYAGLGWRLDAEIVRGDLHLVQMTPPGSPCSIHFGRGATKAAPGSAQRLFLVVSDIEAARAALVDRGVDVSEVFHAAPGEQPTKGPEPMRRTYASYASFEDPDGNGWLLQEVTARLPGRMDGPDTVFTSRGDLAAALRRAEAAHGEHEKRTGAAHGTWPEWYAEYMIAEQGGRPLPQ